MRFNPGERGVSSIIGFLLVMSAFFSVMGYVMVQRGREAGMRADGLIDAMRRAEKRQEQLLTVIHAEEDADSLHVYLYNYGTREAEVTDLWVDGKVVNPDDIADGFDNVLHPNVLEKIVIEDDAGEYIPDEDGYGIALRTRSGLVLTYHVGGGEGG